MKRFVPAAQLTFSTVLKDKARLAVFLKPLKGQEWVFDLSQVTACDSAGLALLVQAKRLGDKHKSPCQFEGVSQTIQSLVKFCGVNMFILEKQGG